MEDHKIFDEPKVDKLLSTIRDFILGTKLTNAEMDFVLNRLWMEVQSSRVAALAMEKIEALDIIEYPIDDRRPEYIH